MDGWFEFVVFLSIFALSIVIDAKRKKGRRASSEDDVEPAEAYQSVITERSGRQSRERTSNQKTAGTRLSTAPEPVTAPDTVTTSASDKEHEALVEEVRKGIIWSEILTRKY